MKRLISLVLSILLIFSLSIPSLALELNEETHITQFSYVVLDADGNVKSSGITPNFSGRYSWPGVTIENGETVIFRKTDGTNFYALKGTRVSYEITKERLGIIIVSFLNALNSTASSGVVVNSSQLTGERVSSSFKIPQAPAVSGSDYYYLTIRNTTSDPMNILSVSLTF